MELLLGEKEAVKFTYEVPDREILGEIKIGELVTEVYIQTDKGLFYLVGSTVREREIYNPIVNQMLSTFRFLE